MDCTHMNHYEKQLYTVFKTFDVDNEEALDKSAVLELCDALQLEDRSAALVDSLFERRSGRVTFTQFRNGLLSVLGGGQTAPLPATTSNTTIAPTASTTLTPQSDEESSSREVAPKFVFGSKKYGRRSRPQHIASDEAPRPRVASDSRLDGERARQRMRCKRSASAMESRGPAAGKDAEDFDADHLDHDRRVNRERALSLCRSLQMTGIDRRLVDGVFENVPTDEITVGDFFDRLNASLSTSIAATLDGTGAPSSDALSNINESSLEDTLPSQAVVEAWERAGVQRSRRLLVELGFATPSVRPPDLERALDDELQAFAAPPDGQADARTLLFLASLAFFRLRLERSQQRVGVAVAERDKLRVDLAEANRRARLLAQDVDENHARIEAELKASLKLVEARHAEAARAAAADVAAERERAAAAHARLQDEVARRADAEVRLRADAAALRARLADLEARAAAAEERAQHAERERARLAADAEAAEKSGAAKADAARLSAARLEAALAELRLENQALRDRNDELCAALEAPPAPAPDTSWRDEAALDASLPLADRPRECNSSSPASHQIALPDEELGKVKSITTSIGDVCLSADGSGAAGAGGGVEAGAQTEACLWPEALDSAKRAHAEEKAQMIHVISDLECSLEQLKADYDKCEEYWAAKLEEERELLGEEQRASDERLAELVQKVGEYERQFARAPLPPIEERAALELQVAALEEEFAAYRREQEARLAARGDELARARRRLDELERARASPVGVAAGGAGGGGGRRITEPLVQGPGCGACACCACAAGVRAAAALRARAARAERAAQRLAARLAAADLLVKDLYLENCRLAHRPRLP